MLYVPRYVLQSDIGFPIFQLHTWVKNEASDTIDELVLLEPRGQDQADKGQ